MIKSSINIANLMKISMLLIFISCTNQYNERITTKISVTKNSTDTITVLKQKFLKKNKIKFNEIIVYRKNIPTYSERTYSDYNFKGQLIKQLILDSYDSIGTSVDYKYENDTLRRKIYNSKKIDEFYSIFKYRNNKLIEIETSDSSNNSISLMKEIFKYSKNNLISESQEHSISIDKSNNDTLSFEKIIYKYDKNELLIEKLKLNSNDNVVSREKYLLDDNLMKTKIIFDNKGNVKASIHYKYEFNDKKKWIKRNTYIDNDLTEMTTREYK